MKDNGKKGLAAGAGLLAAFALWTLLIRTVDVRRIGPRESSVGLAAVNGWFHQLTGVHWTIYTLTDWLGLVPIAVCACFGVLGLAQWISRRSLKRVDADILLLGGYYILVILGYLLFEMVPINYRPVLIDGVLEASYPSSTTLLVLSVMPTLVFQANRRAKKTETKAAAAGFALLFSAFMAGGRLISGVHWLTDIVGAALLSAGLYLLYRSAVLMADQRKTAKTQA